MKSYTTTGDGLFVEATISSDFSSKGVAYFEVTRPDGLMIMRLYRTARWEASPNWEVVYTASHPLTFTWSEGTIGDALFDELPDRKRRTLDFKTGILT